MKPEDLLTITKQELIEALERFNDIYDDVQQNLVMIRSELLSRLEEEKKDGEVIGEYSIKKSKRISFKTTLEEAKEFGAVKEAVDNDVLKKLHTSGVEVPGAQETVFLSVRKMK